MTRKPPPILPETVLHLAWGQTLSLAANEEAQHFGQEVADRLKRIRASLESAGGDAAEVKRNLAYADAVFGAVESAFRNITTILQGRNKNFEDVNSLMQAQIEKIRAIDTVTKDAQSALPRVFAAGGGASAPVVLLAYLGISVPPAVLAALGVMAGSLAYGVYQVVVAPRLKKMVQRALIDADYRRNLYYVQYVKMCRWTLESLFGEVLSAYKAVYGEPYDQRFNDPAQVRAAVDAVVGEKSLVPPWCKYIHKHYHEGKITPDRWSSCESGEGAEQCPLYEGEAQPARAAPERVPAAGVGSAGRIR